MKNQQTRRGNTQIVVKNKVILNLIQDLQRLPLQLINNLRGRFQIKFGMTLLWNKGGFTLIELLIVVLIIGILAAVALPQYQKAVAKARFMRLIPLVRAIYTAEQVYFLENGTYTTRFADLDIEMPGDSIARETSVIEYEDFRCDLSLSTYGFAINCYDNNPHTPRLERYFNESRFKCWHLGDSIAKQICSTLPRARCGENNECWFD